MISVHYLVLFRTVSIKIMKLIAYIPFKSSNLVALILVKHIICDTGT